jgi:hypothetical protein
MAAYLGVSKKKIEISIKEIKKRIDGTVFLVRTNYQGWICDRFVTAVWTQFVGPAVLDTTRFFRMRHAVHASCMSHECLSWLFTRK